MASRRSFMLAAMAAALGGCRDFPLDFAPPNVGLEADAIREGALRIDAATGLLGDEDLMTAFRSRYPQIELEYHRAPSRELHLNFLKEVGAGGPTADIFISAAMDLQFKLVNDGLAQPYESPEKVWVPEWAVWKNEAYAINADPLVFVYNKALMPPEDVPHSHEELTDLLRRKPEAYRGKISSYDVQRSGTGYLYYTQDLLLSRDTLDFVQALGRTQPRLYVMGADLRDKVSSGEHLLAYNMVYSYMNGRGKEHPDLAIIFPSDYTLVMSRIAFIPRLAAHPAAGRLFLDFLLSELGQTLMARSYATPVRVGIPLTGEAPPPEAVRRINFGPELLANLDAYRRQRVLHEWRRAFES
ncbi:MAG TPA: ABC transporter substrate-binding protein [Steroidobacteraceae bacterium]